MVNNRKIVMLLFTCVLFSCFNNNNEKKFYCDTMAESDVRRLPIIEPYEFVTADTSTFWNLFWSPESKKNFPSWGYSADSINYEKGFIFIHSSGNVLSLGVVDLKNERVISFKNRDEFYEFSDTNNLSGKLYSVSSIYRSWVITKKLPWENEIPLLLANACK
jgi:hypothetical protein